jgi:4'-phosphopantetheinyl transferase EntD
VAAVAPAASILGVGIDVEPALPLPEDLLDMIATHENVSSSKAISSRRGCFSA